MEQNNKYTMEDFLVEAQETLEKVNTASERIIESSRINNKTSKFLMWTVSIGLLAVFTLFTDVKIDLGKKADASEVVYKRNALFIEKLKISNDERVAAALLDTTSRLELIREYHQNYLWQIEGIYEINYRGDK